jgi:hypothetical protein
MHNKIMVGFDLSSKSTLSAEQKSARRWKPTLPGTEGYMEVRVRVASYGRRDVVPNL